MVVEEEEMEEEEGLSLFVIVTNEEDEEAIFVRDVKEEAVFTHESIAKDDPPNAHHAQHRPNPWFDECVTSARA